MFKCNTFGNVVLFKAVAPPQLHWNSSTLPIVSIFIATALHLLEMRDYSMYKLLH